MPGKRSNPAQLQKDREAIVKDQESRGPGLFERIVGSMQERVKERKRRRTGQGPMPLVPGAMQHGFKPEGSDT